MSTQRSDRQPGHGQADAAVPTRNRPSTGTAAPPQGDPLKQVLGTTWRPAGRRAKRLPAQIQAQIAERAARWEPAVALEAAEVAVVRELLADAPRRVGEAAAAGYAMTLLILWWYSQDHEFDLKSMLCPSSLVEFSQFIEAAGYSQGTLNSYIPALARMDEKINPNSKKEWKAMGVDPSAKTHGKMPYTDDEVSAFFELAWAQPSVRLRDGLLALLYLMLGVGLQTSPVTKVVGSDVRRADDGIVKVRVGQRWLPVRVRYAAGLLAVAERTHGRPLVPLPRHSGNNWASAFIATLVIPEGTAAPDVFRLPATYRWWVDDQLHLAALVEQCGPNALVQLAGFHRLMPRRPSTAETALLAPADDLEDGPWSPRWPVSHYHNE